MTEVEQLRFERDALQAQLQALEHRTDRRMWFRKSIVILLVVLACLSFTAAVPGVWAQRSFLDTDRFVSRVGPLIDEPEVQEALTLRRTTELMLLIDPQQLFEEVLPARGRLLAAPLANAVEGFVQDRVETFVATGTFAQLWEASARVAHETSASLLRGRRGEVVAVEEGQVTLNLLPVIDALLREIGSVSPEILGREIDIPDLSVEDIPTAAIVRLENALAVDLDDDFGQLTVYDEDKLAAAQKGVELVDRMVVVLLPLSVVFAGVALWMSRHRRRTLLQLAGGVTIGTVLVRRVAFGLEDDLAALPPTDAGRDAAAVAVAVFLDPLTTFAAWSMAVAAVVVVMAVVTGSYPWVVLLRRRVAGLARTVSSTAAAQARNEATAAWVTANRDALLVAGVVVGLFVLWTVELSWLGLLLVIGLVAAFEAVVYRIGTSSDRQAAITHDG